MRAVPTRGEETRLMASPSSSHVVLSRARLVALAKCALMAAALAVLSLVAIPLPISPVPITLQTLGVYLAGGLLGPKWGMAAVGAYVLLGAAGVPVFAGGEAGLGVLLGPKGGYLAGFIPAAALAGAAAQRLPSGGSEGKARSWGGILFLGAGLLGATAAVYACGVAWLSFVTGIGLPRAVVVGVLPFLPGDGLKVIAAVLLIPAIRRSLSSRSS